MSLADDLIRTLRSRGRMPAKALREALGVSRATLMRAVRAAGPAVLTIGQARRTSYAARRLLRGRAAPVPVFEVDERGRSSEVARLHLAYPRGGVLELRAALRWPANESMRDGWCDGLPYFLQDLRPDGFLGRQLARAHARMLEVSDDPRLWSDDDVLHVIALLGVDASGNFIVGEGAYRSWLDRVQEGPLECLEDGEVAQAYGERARLAMQYGPAGSSAAGEFPKFLALRTLQRTPTHVLVEFSGSDRSRGTRRWSDLLVCEHLAGDAAGTLPGLRAARSQVLRSGNRTFLESVRFDRHGIRGRSALCSWAAFDNAWFGLAGRPWTEGAERLFERALIDLETRDAVARLWHFGQLIGNTDMHGANLSLALRDVGRPGPPLELAPVYDMLPMLYAPQRGVELPPVKLMPRLPLPAEGAAWEQSASAAGAFWAKAAGDPRISAGFRAICEQNARAVRKAMGLLRGGTG
ncbi:MAG: type II toxin-antitoxin system HipA family toxin YjjJ [Steroidobacteraceae bacterium]